ncbi:ATP-NAD kinase-like domain-containing protein [Talaromyces proteolyticus]|uniref:ATP-NAD kinase-like domain-containing protein n=1 Tax=Talaromyces proteolyticus TaxID=1131652 RepID=A0AAD4PYI1_9EURO|nr:ATP-NAD kinase-like domain-containing protein [Talaromyces proteolyticus]KAH8701540.1 ATP-NAD kinase-like domain-containing protein [Talaromyces proteolyticus]
MHHRKVIPLYNLLWAEVSGKELVLYHANQTSKKSLICKQWGLKASAFGTEHESDTSEYFVTTWLSRACGKALQKKRAYVLINPNSGSGGALKTARMKLEISDINEFDTITACSGDGTPHEIFNGLAKRPDAGIVLQKASMSHIPCGSANALSYNLYEIMSFLTQALGILAEGDLATEHLRWMGNNRFTIGVAQRVFRRKCYPCGLAVQIEMNDKSRPTVLKIALATATTDFQCWKYGTIKGPIPDSWTAISDDKVGNVYCGNLCTILFGSHCPCHNYVGPDVRYFLAAIDSYGNMDIVTMNGDMSIFKTIKALLSIGSPRFFNSPHVKYKKISAYRITPRDQEDGYISIDGKQVPFELFQAEIHRRLGRVLSKPARLNTVRMGML